MLSFAGSETSDPSRSSTRRPTSSSARSGSGSRTTGAPASATGRGRRRAGGVASRALRLLAGWAAREHGLARLQLMVEPANMASIRVAEKAGFRREGLLRSYIEVKGTRRDVYLYALLPEEM